MNKRTSHLAVALAVIGVGLLVLSGCGRARRDAATVAPSSVPVTAVSASTASTVAGASPSTSTGPAAVDPEQLAEITAELGTVDCPDRRRVG